MVIRYNKSKLDLAFDISNYVLMVILAFLFIYPFWDTIILSLSTPENATKLGLRFYTWPVILRSYGEVFSSKIIYLGYANTIFRTVIGTILTVFVSYCAAYALSKHDLPFRNLITLLVLFTMFFSGGLIATYLNIRWLGLMDTRWALILPSLTGAWYLIIARNFIMSLPKELEDAAMVDGCHPIKMVFYIMLPLSKPILAVLALWTAVMHWNSWFDALIYIRNQNKIVLQLALYRILQEQSEAEMNLMIQIGATGETTTLQTVKAATIIVTIGPILLLYPFLQKYFVKGIMIGSLKG